MTDNHEKHKSTQKLSKSKIKNGNFIPIFIKNKYNKVTCMLLCSLYVL
jgi:hypothetical protein